MSASLANSEQQTWPWPAQIHFSRWEDKVKRPVRWLTFYKNGL